MSDNPDIYKSISGVSEGFLKDRGSKFYGYAFPVINETEIAAAFTSLREQHAKAGHHCYAYRLGTDNNNFRSNDDGEPSGTAGKPILGQIDKLELCDVLVVVVRYWGGTLLGTGGLIQAYKGAAEEALKQAKIIEKTITKSVKLHFDYSLMPGVMNAVKRYKLDIIEQSFNETAYITVAIPHSEVENQLIKLKANILGISFDQVTMKTKIGGLKIDIT